MAEAGKSGARKRRSARRELALPIQVFGTNVLGRDFVEDCVCVKVSRHGAQIRLRHSLLNDDVIRITNRKNHREADFRVVGPAKRYPDKPYTDWGIEALEPDESFWHG